MNWRRHLCDLEPNQKILVETLDSTNGFALHCWHTLGQPEPPSRSQTEQLRMDAMHTKKETFSANEHGQLQLNRAIAPWSLVLIRELTTAP